MDDYGLISQNAREVLEQEFDRAKLHAFVDGQSDIADKLWDLAVEMGWLAAGLPESQGGLGLGHHATFAVLKEFGRRAVPGALPPAAIAAAFSAEQPDGSPMTALGEGIAAGALKPFIPGTTCASALVVTGDKLSGEMSGLWGARNGNAILAPATRDGKKVIVLADATAAAGSARFDTLWDLTRATATLSFDGAAVTAVIDDADGAQKARLLTLLRLALAADSVGGQDAILDLVTAYTKERQQFGRPVGSFQAIKHRIADLFINNLPGRKLVDLGVDALTQQSADIASMWASIAKTDSVDAYVKATEEAVLLHGGVGFTWEFDPHIYLKRSRLALALGGDNRALRDAAWTTLKDTTATGQSTAELAA